jgi:hypothetical protein
MRLDLLAVWEWDVLVMWRRKDSDKKQHEESVLTNLFDEHFARKIVLRTACSFVLHTSMHELHARVIGKTFADSLYNNLPTFW